MIGSFVLLIAHGLLLLAVSPLIIGIIRKSKARLQCRRGPSLVQPYFDLVKLFKKEAVVSVYSSWIFRATPYILFASTLTAALLVPAFLTKVPIDFAGDIITMVYLLALGTFFMMLAGLDSGSPFGGMGSSREAIVAVLTEPAMILAIFAVGLTAGSTNLSTIVQNLALSHGIMSDPPPHLLALAALFIATLAETSRVPVDNPVTHLELTMIHEAMILEYSGRYLALIEWASSLKLLLFLTLLSNVFFPWGIATRISPAAIGVGIGAWFLKVSLFAILIGIVESMFAKLRLFRITELLGVAFILSLLSLVFYYILRI